MKMWMMFLCLNPGLLLAAAGTPIPASDPITPSDDETTHLVDWLMKYGYLPPPDPSTGQLQAWTAVTDAIRAMQRFAGLNGTGVLDEETAALMKSPRCSLPDQEEPSETPAVQEERKRRRQKRTVSMWTRRSINWRLRSYPPSSHLPREMIRSLVFYALRVWGDPTPLEFHEVGSPEAADLQVDFLRGYHGDGYPFDGAGGAVGHAFFPSDPARAGGVHLDAEEQWTFRQPASEGTDLFTVLVHEFGHALGLAHSSSRHSVMRPYYQGPAGDPLHYRLGQQDLEHITKLYGRRTQLLAADVPGLQTEPQHQPEHHHHHHHHRHGASIDRCNTSFDAVAKIRGEIFFFKGQMVWRVNGGGLVSTRGASVRRLWRGLPPDLPHLRAVLERQSDHAIIFISGSRFWLFRDLTLQDGYPQPLSALRTGTSPAAEDSEGDDANEEAGRWGLVWDAKEGPAWGRVGRPEEKEAEDMWSQLLKEGVNGITTDEDGSVHLFRGDTVWKFSFPGSSLQEGYPQSSAAAWLDCATSLPSVDDVSLSLSHPGGKQNLRETWREEREEDIGRRRERHGHEDKYREDSESRSGTWCTCQSSTAAGRRTSGISVLLLVPWTLLMSKLKLHT